VAENQAVATKAAATPANAHLAAVLAWIIPGAGHFLIGRRGRALVYAAIVLTNLAVGYSLSGNLDRVVPGQPLSLLATLGSMGTGAIYFLLRYVAGYQGDLLAQSYEYGTAFLRTAGLMNWLLVLDAWDIARGKKE
jgi:TM2 domain-containing membrane protein YozV